MIKRVALYVRVSTDKQTVENQQIELEKVAKQRGWEIVAIYADNGVSGAKGREHRKQFDKLIKDATRAKFDIVAAWSVDRLGRSMQHLVTFLNELHEVGCDLYLHQQGIDTTTPAGRALFGMSAVFAEFERSMIQERVKAGLERAKKKGKKLGRPTINEKTKTIILNAHREKMSIRKAAALANVSIGTAHNIIHSQH